MLVVNKKIENYMILPSWFLIVIGRRLNESLHSNMEDGCCRRQDWGVLNVDKFLDFVYLTGSLLQDVFEARKLRPGLDKVQKSHCIWT